jgi:hypothetical protein
MLEPAKLNFRVYQGSTFLQQLRWESETKTYIPIINVTKTAPVQILLSSSTNIPPVGWRVRVTGVQGMKEVNMPEDNYVLISAKTGSTIEINSINSIQYTTYTGSGTLVFNTPVSLQGYTGRMQIRKKLKDELVILELNSSNGGILVNNTDKTISITMTPQQTAVLDFTSAVYDLELIDSSGRVIRFAQGNLILQQEVTR